MKPDRKIIIDGPFGTGMATEVCNQLLTLSAKSNEDILLIVKSFGGACTAAFAIIDTIRLVEARCNVVTLGVGYCQSAGALIVAGGTKGKRFALPSVRFMFHGPNGVAVTTIKGLDTMRYFKEEQENMYSEITGRPPLYFDEIMDRDFHCTPKEAIGHGLLDGVIGSIYETEVE